MNQDAIAAIGPDDLQRIDGIIHDYVAGAGLRCAFVVDRQGRPVSASGDAGRIDPLSFASLAAADFESSNQLAGLLGEAEFMALFHQGAEGSMYLVDLAGVLILAAIFDDRSSLGRVRLASRTIVPRFLGLLDELAARPAPRGHLVPGWGEAAVHEIDRLFAG
jgi:predicted regulator of Ras-like GTPase activity (Roadblock/LC7/MglB family)